MNLVPSKIFFTKGPEKAWDEREQIYKMSGKIVRTMNVTQSAKGNKDGLWTTVFAAAVFCDYPS